MMKLSFNQVRLLTTSRREPDLVKLGGTTRSLLTLLKHLIDSQFAVGNLTKLNLHLMMMLTLRRENYQILAVRLVKSHRLKKLASLAREES